MSPSLLSLTEPALAIGPLVKNSNAVTYVVASQLRAAGLDPDPEALSLLAMSAGLGTSILGGQSSPGQAQAVIDTTYQRLVTVSGRIYVTDFGSAEVTVLDGSRCNASVTSGCGAPVREQAVGSQPVGLAVSPQTSTVYVIDTFQAGSMSILASQPGLHGSDSVRWLARDTSHARASLAPELLIGTGPHRRENQPATAMSPRPLP